MPLRGHLAMSEDTFGHHRYDATDIHCKGCCQTYNNAQDSPQPRIISPQMSVVPKLRNPDLHKRV